MVPSNFTVVPASLRPRPARLVFQQGLLPLASAALGLDVVHSPSFIMPLWRGRARHVLSVHDMTMFTMGAYHIPLRRSAPFLRAVAASIRRAHLVCVPTHAVRADLLRLMPDVPPARVRVVAPGIGAEFRPADGSDPPLANQDRPARDGGAGGRHDGDVPNHEGRRRPRYVSAGKWIGVRHRHPARARGWLVLRSRGRWALAG